MLRTRLLIGSLLIALLLFVFWIDRLVERAYPGWLLLCTVFAGLACGELTELLARADLRPFRRVLWPAVLGLIWIHWLPALPGWDGVAISVRWSLVLLGLALSFIAAVLVGMATFTQGTDTLRRAASTCFALLYLGGGGAALAGTRWLPEGWLATALLILATKGADGAAYFVGLWMGRRPLAPVLSPKKTVEGAVGGVLGAVAGGLLAFYLLPSPCLPVGAVLVAGAALGIWGQVGDLVESWLKRVAQAKDSSPWLPGLGGILDVLDSLIWNAPPFALWWSLMAGGLGG